MTSPSLPADYMRTGAFVRGVVKNVPPTGSGPLDGASFAIKDLIDLKGEVTGGGNPDWAKSAIPALEHAEAVRDLLAAGATCLGKTITDELAFSLEGRNLHYGNPSNPRHPDWLPGGSSSGSAVSVAAGCADFALGTDTGGSVRVPAAFCGIFGFRPSHGIPSLQGVFPFAPSYDSVGWFARDARTLRTVGEVLLPPAKPKALTVISLAEDCLDHVDPAVAEDLAMAATKYATAPPTRVLANFSLEEAVIAYGIIQGFEIKQSLRQSIEKIAPRFAPDIASRFAAAFMVSRSEYEKAQRTRVRITRILDALTSDGRALLLPCISVPYLTKDTPEQQIGEFYHLTLGLTSLAGHAKMPQLQLGLQEGNTGTAASLLSARGTDRALMDLAVHLEKTAQPSA